MPTTRATTGRSFRQIAGDRYRAVRNRVFDPLIWWLSKRELHRGMAGETLDSILTAERWYRGRGPYARLRAMQKPGEIRQLAELVRQHQPRTVVEIGTAWGGTLHVWTRLLRSAELVVSIDLPGGRFGGGYDEHRQRLYEEFAFGRPDLRLCLLRADSHAPETLDQVRRLLNGRPLDFLWIDGDHSYEGAKADFVDYGALVRDGGLVAFHDIRTFNADHEVHKVWTEVSPQYEHVEYVEGNDGRMGIGVLYMKRDTGAPEKPR